VDDVDGVDCLTRALDRPITPQGLFRGKIGWDTDEFGCHDAPPQCGGYASRWIVVFVSRSRTQEVQPHWTAQSPKEFGCPMGRPRSDELCGMPGGIEFDQLS
jgi:hypothetical protein